MDTKAYEKGTLENWHLLTSGSSGTKLSVTLAGGSCLLPFVNGPSTPPWPARVHVTVNAAGRARDAVPAAPA